MTSPSAKPAKRKSPRMWITLRKIVQTLALLAAFALVIGSGRAGWSGELGSILLQIDPLAALTSMMAGRAFFIGALWALLLLGLTLLVGRAWCGWLCPLGTLLDLFSLRRLRGRRRPPSEAWRKVKYALLLLILFAALFGNLTLMVLDPVTLFERTVSSSLLPALDRGITAAEAALYRTPALREFIMRFDELIRPEVLPRTPAPSRAVLLYAGIFIGIVALNVVAERFWCRYLCPLGGLLGLLSKIGLVRREVNSACEGCQLCTRACPTGTIRPEENYASDPSECTMCLECMDACPWGGVSFPARIGAADWQAYDPSRRQALITFGASLAGVGLMQLGKLDGENHPHKIQPPGALENDLLAKCVRCGLCIAVCPTGGLQPAITEAGVEGFWTPVLVPRLGYCNYACNACGMVCPTEAIPALSVEQKQRAVIGKAQIDQDRCLPWSQGIPCIVCEEMCPLPEKAITLEEVETRDAFGGTLILQRPQVLHNRCIGCGVCEYKCPAEGPAAIRVYSPQMAHQQGSGQGQHRGGRGNNH